MKKSIVSLVNKFGRFFGVNIIRVYSSLGNPLSIYGISKKEFVSKGNEGFYLEKANVSVNKTKHNFFLEGYATVVKLIERLGAKVSLENGELIIDICGVKYYLLDKIDLFVLDEVFLEGSYNLTNLKQNTVLIDIGLNVGITSLYFASKKEILTTYSYEPFTPTYDIAQRNLLLNPKFASKVKTFNVGLGESDCELEIDYLPDNKAIMSIYGEKNTANSNTRSKEKIQISNAKDIFLRIRNEYPENSIICKMDCEGAEYEIVKTLKTDPKSLSVPDVYMIEWHNRNPMEIVAALSSSGYNILQTTTSYGTVGMIYAFRL